MRAELLARTVRTRHRPSARPVRHTRAFDVTFRAASPDDVPAIHALVDGHVAEGHLLPRSIDELAAHAPQFVVATRGGRLVGCAELAPLSARVAEVRSLVVDGSARGGGVGRQLVALLEDRARLEGYGELCAFTHEPDFFVRMGFSIVPHARVPEKIARDCQACALFRRCGQTAVIVSV